MRVAVVMPQGCRMDGRRFNSMEAVAAIMSRHSRFASGLVILCDAGAETPAALPLVTVPAGLTRAAWRRAVVDRLRAFRPDLVEYHQHLSDASTLARRVQGPVQVLYRHTRIKPPGNLIARLRYQRRLEAFDHLLFVSRAAAEEFAGDYPAVRGARSWIRTPIEMAAWTPPEGPREPLILFVGRALPEKGMDAFCAALDGVLARHPSWRGALVLGEFERHRTWATPHLQTLARYGDRVEVHRTATLAEVMAVTRRAAIAVTPSRIAEALGLTALEAHAAGAALVSSGRGGLAEVSGPHALYVDPPEPAPLAAAIERLILDAPLRARLAQAGRAHVADAYSPEARARELDDLRLQLVTARSSRLSAAA